MNKRMHWCLLAASCAAAPALAAEQSTVDEVVVTATPLRQSPLETAQPASVLQGEKLQREVAVSIGETLEKQLGVTGTYFGPSASRPVIRGLGGERVQVLEDTMGSLDVSALSEDHAVAVEPLLADRVEVIKGPATLLYGNAAVGGVVNVITNRIPSSAPESAVGGALELRGDTASSETSGAARLDAGAGGFAFHADLYRRKTDDVEIPGFALSDRLRSRLTEAGEPFTDPRGTLLSTEADSHGGAAGASWIGSEGFIGASFSRYESAYGVPGPETLEDGSGVRIDLSQDRYDLAGEWREPAAGIDAVRVRASHNDYGHQEFEPDGAPGTLFEQRAAEARVSFDHALLASWRGTFGAQLRDVDFTATGEEAFVPPSRTRHAGLFVFEERPVGPVKIELGGRVEQQKISIDETLVAGSDYEETSLNASAGVLWKLPPAHAVSLNFTRTQRHPSSTELYANGPHVAAGRFEIGDAQLRKETAVTGDLTFRRIAGQVRFDVTLFVSRYEDYIFPLPTGGLAGDEEPFPVVQYVQRDADFRGFEGQIATPLMQKAGGELELRLATDYVRGKLSGGDNLPQVPPWRVGAELTFERDRWSAGFSTFYYGEQDRVAANELPTDSYTMVDLDLGYELPAASGSLLLFVKAANLADEEARRHSSPLKDFAPLPGRSIRAGVRLQF